MDNYSWFLVIVLIIGLLGTFMPLLPGLWLMSFSLLVYGLFDGWQDYSIWFFIVSVLLSLLGSLIDFGGAVIGAKKFGASDITPIGTVAGSIVGGIFGKVSGTFLGGLLGTLFTELYHKKEVSKALKASAGSVVGMAVSSFAQFLIGFILLVATVMKLWR